MNAPFTHLQNVRDGNQLGVRSIIRIKRQLRDKTSKTRSKESYKPRQPMRYAWVQIQIMRGIPWTLIMMRTLTGRHPVTHWKEAMLLDMKGVRNGDQNHLMQPNSLY